MLDFKPSYVSQPGRLPQDSCKDLNGGALSCTVRSEKSEELAIIDLEGYSFDSLGTIPVGFYQVLDLDCRQLSKPLSYQIYRIRYGLYKEFFPHFFTKRVY